RSETPDESPVEPPGFIHGETQGEILTGRWYQKAENALAIAQRVGKKNQVRAIHDGIASRRNDGRHRFALTLGQFTLFLRNRPMPAKLNPRSVRLNGSGTLLTSPIIKLSKVKLFSSN